MRLVKFLANAGVASRRASEKLIAEGLITIGGEVAHHPAQEVTDEDDVRYKGEPVRLKGLQPVVFMLNKPLDVVCTASDPQGRRIVVDLVKSDERLYPVGRLDRNTTGLILLTNNGELAYRLTHPSFKVPKIYRAKVMYPPVSAKALTNLRNGVLLDDGQTAPARVRQLLPGLLELVIHEGRKRQVRRMCKTVGHPVIDLERISLGPLALGDLALGEYRKLTDAEVAALEQASGGAQT